MIFWFAFGCSTKTSTLPDDSGSGGSYWPGWVDEFHLEIAETRQSVADADGDLAGATDLSDAQSIADDYELRWEDHEIVYEYLLLRFVGVCEPDTDQLAAIDASQDTIQGLDFEVDRLKGIVATYGTAAEFYKAELPTHTALMESLLVDLDAAHGDWEESSFCEGQEEGGS